MRAGGEYRAARRNEARRRRLVWRELDMIADGNGSRRVKYPFEKNRKKIEEKPDGE